MLVIGLASCALPSPSPSPTVLATSRFSDPVGDVEATTDLAAVTAIATARDVRIDIEFASDFVADHPPDAPGSGLFITIADPAWAEPGGCGGYVTRWVVAIPPMEPAPSGETWTAELREGEHPVGPLDATISPRLVTVTVPLAQIENPEVLNFAVIAFGPTADSTVDAPPDFSPDELRDEGACHSAPLTEGALESPSSR